MKRLKRIHILLKLLYRSILHGRAVKVPSQINRIIVAPTGKLGDVVCNTPVFQALRQNLPNVYIIAAGNPQFLKSILDHSGLVDEYLDIENSDIRADVGIVTGPSYEYAAELYLSGIPLVVAPTVIGGRSPAETRPYKILKKFVKTFHYRMGEYAPRERLKSLEALGISSDDTRKILGFSKVALEKISNFFIEHDVDIGKDLVAGISPSAGNKIKEWPEERFAQVADYLIQNYKAKVILIGGPKDKEKIKKVLSHSNLQNQIIEASDFNLDELKALISKLSIFISVDSGPIYIAEAFEVPTIDITGPIDEKEQPPIGLKHRVVVPPERKKPELYVLNAKHYDKKEALRQVLSIEVPSVLREINNLL
ncbi:MAG: glycosyltransferase family 9 protein [Minisyncoccia bacterium]